MAETAREYRKLDFSKIAHRISKTSVPSEEALKDVAPFPVPQEVLDKEKQIIIDTDGIHYV